MDNNINSVDVIAFGAHPDDIEISCAGTVTKLVEEGKSVLFVDLTKGELGTRGNADIRQKESAEAAHILKAAGRINLDLGDGNVIDNIDNQLKVISLLRQFKPSTVIFHPSFDRHPDHENTHRLIRNSVFKSGLHKIETFHNNILQDRVRAIRMYCYLNVYELPNKSIFYVDISDTFARKMSSIRAYISQVYVPGKSDSTELETRLSKPEFLDEIEARAIFFGSKIGVKYAEAFYAVEPIGIKSLSNIM